MGSLPGFETSIKIAPKEINIKYHQLFRLMTKKCSITRQKALAEFTADISTNETSDSIKLILQYWPTIYSQVANDAVAEVRIEAQKAQFAVATVGGKELAIALRQLAPVWIKSRFDINEESASIALHSFNNTFPHKLKAVLKFCQTEFLQMILNHVLEQYDG